MDEAGNVNTYQLWICITRVHDDLMNLLEKYRGEQFFDTYLYKGQEHEMEKETTLLLIAMFDRFLQKRVKGRTRANLMNDLVNLYCNGDASAEPRACGKQTIKYTKLLNATFKIASMYKGCPPGEPLASAFSSVIFDSKEMNRLREDERISERFQNYMDTAVNYFTRIHSIYSDL